MNPDRCRIDHPRDTCCSDCVAKRQDTPSFMLQRRLQELNEQIDKKLDAKNALQRELDDLYDLADEYERALRRVEAP